MRNFIGNYSLSLALAGMFIASWIVQTIAGWIQFVAQQQEHDQEPQAFGPDGYFWEWLQSTMENWQSEFLQLFTFVVLTTFLIHKRSPESRDSDEQIEARLERIVSVVEEIRETQQASQRKGSKK